MSLLRCAIWLCIYWRKVNEVHLPIFIIVVSDAPLSLRAIAPPALKECTPTRSGVIPACVRSRFATAFLRCCIMSVWDICPHVFVELL